MQTNDATGKAISIGTKVSLGTLKVVGMQANAQGDFLILMPIGVDASPVTGVQPITAKASLVEVET